MQPEPAQWELVLKVRHNKVQRSLILHELASPRGGRNRLLAAAARDGAQLLRAASARIPVPGGAPSWWRRRAVRRWRAHLLNSHWHDVGLRGQLRRNAGNLSADRESTGLLFSGLYVAGVCLAKVSNARCEKNNRLATESERLLGATDFLSC